MEKYRHLRDEIINLTSTNRGFIANSFCVATYEQTKKGLSYCSKRIVQSNSDHTAPHNY